jgi:hypothetical protein
MHSMLLDLFRRFFSSVRRTILYPPRWTSLPGVYKAEVIKLGEVHRGSGDRQPTSSETAAGAYELTGNRGFLDARREGSHDRAVRAGVGSLESKLSPRFLVFTGERVVPVIRKEATLLLEKK